MPRRVSLPAADDLFRSSTGPERSGRPERAVKAAPEPASADAGADPAVSRRSSGRVRHDEKMTVYVTADELLDLESARLRLRRDQGLAVDRGRLVREAVSIVLADLEEQGDDSEIVRRLRTR